jgi:hypothetical protein
MGVQEAEPEGRKNKRGMWWVAAPVARARDRTCTNPTLLGRAV